jgi:proline iminopeptidase
VTTRADDGCVLWTETVGDGRPLVLCHGGPGLWDMFGDVAPGLAGAAGVTAVRWDQRGCGRSQRRGPYSLARSVADLDAVRAGRGVPAVDLLGHSWGATLALAYALAHPDRVRSLVYVSGTGVDPDDPWRPAFYAKAEARLGPSGVARRAELRAADPLRRGREVAVLEWSAEFEDADRAVDLARAMADPWYELNRECSAAVNEDVRAWLPGVEARCRELAVPVLIVDGERDIRPRWAVDSLHRALPRVRRVTLPGAGHLPWVEDPAGFRRAVVGFLGVTAGDAA